MRLINFLRRLRRPTPAQALTNTIEWLRANPTRHVEGQFAVDVYGRGCNPNSSKASCFCFVGRLARELRVSGPDVSGQVAEAFGVKESAVSRLMSINDSGHLNMQDRAECSTTTQSWFRGNPDVLDRAPAILNAQ